MEKTIPETLVAFLCGKHKMTLEPDNVINVLSLSSFPLLSLGASPRCAYLHTLQQITKPNKSLGKDP